MSVPDKITELFQGDIQTAIEDTLCLEYGTAKVIADDIFKRIQKNWGGSRLYIPAADKVARNQAIRAMFNGRNHAEVCKHFDVCLSHLYSIIR